MAEPVKTPETPETPGKPLTFEDLNAILTQELGECPSTDTLLNNLHTRHFRTRDLLPLKQDPALLPDLEALVGRVAPSTSLSRVNPVNTSEANTSEANPDAANPDAASTPETEAPHE